ncbi:hypothetical protein OROMI_012513 [Orobanche minor]
MTTGTTPFNTSIFVDLKFQRSTALVNMYFKDLKMILFYSTGITPVAGYRVRAFSMGGERTVHRMAVMKASDLLWEEAFRAVSGGSTVELVVEFPEKNEITSWVSDVVLRAHVAVDASGHMVSEGLVKFSI